MQRRAISDPAFNAAHVAPPDLRDVGKCLLRQSLLLPQLANSESKSPEGWMSGGLTRLARHVTDAGVLGRSGTMPLFSLARPTAPDLMRYHRLLQTGDQRRQRRVERSCQSRNGIQARIAPAALDSADVGDVEIRALGELLLRQATTVPEPPDALPERRPQIVHGQESCREPTKLKMDDRPIIRLDRLPLWLGGVQRMMT